MQVSPDATEVKSREARIQTPRSARYAHKITVFLLISMVIWSPFPLGSNREWSWSVLLIMGALTWLSWAHWAWHTAEAQRAAFKRYTLPLVLAGSTIIWGALQALPVFPTAWAHPIWSTTLLSDSRAAPPVISIDPWATWCQVFQLALYLAICCITYSISQRAKTAKWLFNAIAWTGAAFAIYAFLLKALNFQQFELFYSTALPEIFLSGPFVQRNSFATYEGMASVVAVAQLVDFAKRRVVTHRGVRRMLFSTLNTVLGSGAGYLVVALLCISALIGTASRAGFVSTIAGFAIMASLLIVKSGRGNKFTTIILTVVPASLLILALFWIEGGTLSARFDDLVAAGAPDEVRTSLWSAAWKMVISAPMLGLGLGTFQSAYPLYASRVLPYIMDKAHCDYLEFAAGAGLPAACAWWGAMSLASGRLLKGALSRNRDSYYSASAFGALVLVGAHSAVDFSLQIPAVALIFSMIIGIGLAQSHSRGKDQ